MLIPEKNVKDENSRLQMILNENNKSLYKKIGSNKTKTIINDKKKLKSNNQKVSPGVTKKLPEPNYNKETESAMVGRSILYHSRDNFVNNNLTPNAQVRSLSAKGKIASNDNQIENIKYKLMESFGYGGTVNVLTHSALSPDVRAPTISSVAITNQNSKTNLKLIAGKTQQTTSQVTVNNNVRKNVSIPKKYEKRRTLTKDFSSDFINRDLDDNDQELLTLLQRTKNTSGSKMREENNKTEIDKSHTTLKSGKKMILEDEKLTQLNQLTKVLDRLASFKCSEVNLKVKAILELYFKEEKEKKEITSEHSNVLNTAQSIQTENSRKSMHRHSKSQDIKDCNPNLYKRQKNVHNSKTEYNSQCVSICPSVNTSLKNINTSAVLNPEYITSEFERLKKNYETLLSEYKHLKETIPKITGQKENTTNITNQIFFTDSNNTYAKSNQTLTKSTLTSLDKAKPSLKLSKGESNEKPRMILSSTINNRPKTHANRSSSKNRTPNSGNSKSKRKGSKGHISTSDPDFGHFTKKSEEKDFSTKNEESGSLSLNLTNNNNSESIKIAPSNKSQNEFNSCEENKKDLETKKSESHINTNEFLNDFSKEEIPKSSMNFQSELSSGHKALDRLKDIKFHVKRPTGTKSDADESKKESNNSKNNLFQARTNIHSKVNFEVRSGGSESNNFNGSDSSQNQVPILFQQGKLSNIPDPKESAMKMLLESHSNFASDLNSVQDRKQTNSKHLKKEDEDELSMLNLKLLIESPKTDEHTIQSYNNLPKTPNIGGNLHKTCFNKGNISIQNLDSNFVTLKAENEEG